MSRDLTMAERDALEALLDRTSVSAVLAALADLCGEKAQHIAENWQDRPLYESWREVEDLIHEVVFEVAKQEKGRT